MAKILNFALFKPIRLPKKAILRFSGRIVRIDYALLPNREWNKKQKHKTQPWGNVECFAFGEVIVRLCVIGNEFPCHRPR